MAAAGMGAVVLGGLVAAATDPLDLTWGSWVAAYLVLVVGVTQVAMGCARLGRAVTRRARRLSWAQFGGWNIGSLAVVVGTLSGRPWLVDAGSMLLVILAVSIPVGIVLSHLRYA